MNYSKAPEARTTRRTAITVGAIAVTSALMLVLPAIALTTTTALAAKPADADCWGDVTSDAATEDGQVNLGQHSSAAKQEQPRVGLPNALDSLSPEGVPTPRDPEHPSELWEALDGTIDEDICP